MKAFLEKSLGKKWSVIGLNKYESAVYDAIVKIGKGTAARIAKTSGVPYGRIYDVLDSLISKNLVRIIPGKPRTYSIANPQIIEKMLKEKEKEFEEIEKEIKKLKRIYESAPEEAVLVATGKRAWYELVRELKSPPKKFSYKIRYTAEYHPEWVREERREIKKGVDVKAFVRYDEETKQNVKKWLKHTKNIRAYPNKGVAFWIADDFVLIALIKSNATVLIRDKAFVDMLKHLFEDAYKNAKVIK
ncbi:MAG: helix-turn-helix domain-containing protein [Nanoarchaeota archaeon]|nr:helix-turn-helix domain-containing protein [Nanoarchaeota archaeon]